MLGVDTDYILSLCSQRIILMKRLCHQGLALTYLLIVSQAIIVSRIMYAILAYGCFLSTGLNGRFNAFLKRRYRYGFASEIQQIDSMFDNVCRDLFSQIR